MKLAISNIAWSPDQDEGMYQFLCDQGMDGLEIAPTRIFPEKPYERLKEAGDFAAGLKENFGLEIPSIQSICYGRSDNIFESRELIEYIKDAILFAEAIGCRNLVFGCPKNRALSQEWIAGRFPKVIWRRVVKVFAELGEFAWSHNTILGLEPNPAIYGTNFMNTTKEAIALIEDVDSPGFRLNLDFGAVIHNQEPMSTIKEGLKFISHVHISEPGLGLIVRRKLHKELADLLWDNGYEGFVSVEMGRNELTEVQKAVLYLKEVFD